MMRIPTLLGLGLLTVGLIVGVVVVQRVQRVSPRAAESTPTPENITISNITDQSLAVSWTTSTPATGFLEVGTSVNALSRRVLDDRDKTLTTPGAYGTHYVTVDALKENTTYRFRIGEGVNTSFDQNGTPFSVTTGTTLPINPVSDSAQGSVVTSAHQPAHGAVVYAQLPNTQLLSALVGSGGNWIIPLSTARVSDGSAWVTYDQQATTYALRVEGGVDGRSDATLTTATDRPVPQIVLGQTYDFRQSNQPAIVRTGQEQTSLFEFSSLGPVTPLTEGVTLENPGKNGEVIGTDTPEFFGKGPAGSQIEITVKSSQTISGNAQVSSDGTWSFAVPSSLAPGAHEMTMTWTDAQGVLQTLTRSFVVNASAGPAFTSTPSATPTVNVTPGMSVSPTSKPTAPPKIPSPTPKAGGPPRSVVPSGTPPESGSLTPSLFLFMMGIFSVVAGAVLVRQGTPYGR